MCLGGPMPGLKDPKGPHSLTECLQSNSFNNFYNSHFFVIVRPKNVRRSVGALKRGNRSCKHTSIFSRHDNLLGSASISRGVRIHLTGVRIHLTGCPIGGWGWGKLPHLPPPRGDATAVTPPTLFLISIACHCSESYHMRGQHIFFLYVLCNMLDLCSVVPHFPGPPIPVEVLSHLCYIWQSARRRM